MKALQDKVVPAVQARRGPWRSSSSSRRRSEQDAIVARYPELRGCTTDQVIFLDGGTAHGPGERVA